MKKEIKPFLKWAGGKRQILPELLSRIPKTFNTYYEPFVGAGALFIELQHPSCVINDNNRDLMAAYKTIKMKPYNLMNELDDMNAIHKNKQKEYYLEVRARDREPSWTEATDIDRAVRLLYLNKYCFNGLYRVNSKNQFNVPYNNKEFVKLFDRENIINLSEYLYDNKVDIRNEDFEDVLKNAHRGDFIYFDPPYDVLKAETFDSYSKDSFGKEGQVRLAKVFKELDQKGCYVMLSNHNTELITELYSEFKIEVIHAKRVINSKASGRGNIEEVIIRNY